MAKNQTMQLIMTTYPGFHDLPKGVKKMLLVSEDLFFEQTRMQTEHSASPSAATLPLTVVIPPNRTASAFAVSAPSRLTH